MADIFSAAKRSMVMARIGSRGNRSTEHALEKLLRTYGIKGWRRHLPLFGRPDFVFRAEKLVVFVDGCFWHGCPQHGTLPRQNEGFWARKLTRNRARDRLVSRTLKSLGWNVLRIWEHQLKGDIAPLTVRRIRRCLEAGGRLEGCKVKDTQ